jgi:hypothetical protein
MPAGDQFGAVTFPVPVPAAGTVAGDPALGYLLAFLRASVNAACGEMWESICPGRVEPRSPIPFTFAHDPKKLFDDSRLPALYCWRGKSKRTRVADDLYRRTTDIQIVWINEPGQEEHTVVIRDPAMNAISDAIDNAITGDRDPAWIVAGDADPLAAIHGSSLLDRCDFSRCQPVDDGPQELLFQRIEEAAPLPYYGFVMTVEVDEYQSKYATGIYPSKLNASAATNAAPPVPIRIDVPPWTPP